MTDRGPLTGLRGAPDPDEPAHGDSPARARPPAVPPADLSAVRRTDALIESLAARAAASSATSAEGSPEGLAEEPADDPAGARRGVPPDDDRDPAVRLLRALIVDVDDQACDAPG
ncbi:hypothetical protein GWI34_21235, partial [Actinomadura sp. DSM 109109]|nr:hypothetical protein [Actinomadura lepetitiana]